MNKMNDQLCNCFSEKRILLNCSDLGHMTVHYTCNLKKRSGNRVQKESIVNLCKFTG